MRLRDRCAAGQCVRASGSRDDEAALLGEHQGNPESHLGFAWGVSWMNGSRLPCNKGSSSSPTQARGHPHALPESWSTHQTRASSTSQVWRSLSLSPRCLALLFPLSGKALLANSLFLTPMSPLLQSLSRIPSAQAFCAAPGTAWKSGTARKSGWPNSRNLTHLIHGWTPGDWRSSWCGVNHPR